MYKKTFVVLAGMLVLFGFGCNPVQRTANEAAENAIENAIEQEGGGEADVDVNNGQVRVRTNEGEYSVGAGASLPSDWPQDVAIIEGAQLQVSGSNYGTSSGDAGAGVMFTTTKSSDEVVGFYRDQLTNNGWVVKSTASMNGFVVMTAEKDNLSLSFSVQSVGEQTTVIIGLDK